MRAAAFYFIIPLSVLNKSPDKDTVDKFADKHALIWSKGEESKKVHNNKRTFISSVFVQVPQISQYSYFQLHSNFL